MSQINVTIDGNLYKTESEKTILEFCTEIGIKIPTLCHDPRLEPYSSCYLCVVEVEGAKGLQTSCSTKLQEGMKIQTNNEKVRKSRKMALDLLQSNHFASCQAPCKSTCPAGVDVQGYISLIDKGLYHEAVKLIKEVNPLPAICGRVCVRPCEAACNRNFMDEGTPVGIDYMKRFAADFDLYSKNHYKPEIQASTGKKIAVIGAGPGGLSAAYFLQQRGHQVDIFEANKHAGGWLRYGIPEYRLPNDLLDKEIETVTELGTQIFLNQKLGDNLSYEKIKKEYQATILTIGAQRGTLLGVEGEDAEGVYSGIDFLRNMEQTGQKYDFSGKTVVVVGGGNTAMDCCRTSIRCKAEKTYIVYRRTEKEMPANPIEIHESKLEGVEYLFLTNPTKVNKDENGKLKSITCVKMTLGEPDSSGRRRPVPMEGSDFEIDADYILAAIGQKVDADFVNHINQFSDKGELKLSKWGTIQANEKTLQTDIPSVFAAGDGVTGPATIIEAIAQAGIAARSCHQFIMGEKIEPKSKEFLSKKSNFVKPGPKAFIGKYEKHLRQEMPVLNEKYRINFQEVELGYTEEMALQETARCFECGCTEYFNCDLKDYSTEYEAEQEKFKGEFTMRPLDFSHPYIEIDNNKCILCSRCVRICKEVVGAGALGLVNRGFDTYVAPSLGLSLTETECESCGLCISTCPTGAITENVKFKAGPVKMDSFDTICNYCSIGCKLTIHHRAGFVMKVTGANGLVNKDGNHCKFGKFGYSYFNDKTRITKPLLKIGDKLEEISFEKAFKIIAEKINSVKPNENAFYAGARLTNEEIYLVQKLARAGAKTNNISSFHYAQRENGYIKNYFENVPFEEISKAEKIYLFGAELNNDNGVVGFMVQNARAKKNVTIDLITSHENSGMKHKADNIFHLKSYYKFIKAVNHFLLSNNLQNQFFIDGNSQNFEQYKENLLKENFDDLVAESGVCCKGTIINFATDFNKTQNAIIIFSEKEVSANTSFELQNLALLTGKLGKTANGIIALKEKNNSQALFDMGSFSELGIGAVNLHNSEEQNKLKNKWNLDHFPTEIEEDQFSLLQNGKIKNTFIFGEDPIGCAIDKAEIEELFVGVDFIMVQDYFLTDTAKYADLILPASFPVEIGGSFTNTQKVIQEFEKAEHFGNQKLEKNSYQQLFELLKLFNINGLNNREDVISEIISLLPEATSAEKLSFTYTNKCNTNRRFNHGCDSLVRRFKQEFNANF